MVLSRLITHVAEADHSGHVLQLAIAIGRAGQAVERVVGDIEFHHARSDAPDPLGLRMDDESIFRRCGARSRCPATPIDVDDAEPAGAEGLDTIGCAELRDFEPGQSGRAHHAGALRHRDLETVNGQGDCLMGARLGCAKVAIMIPGYNKIPHAAVSFSVAPKCSGKWRSADMTG